MRYRLIVWDFDGTLADTVALALATYNELAPRHGCRPVDDPAAVRGMSTRAFLRRHGVSLVRLPRLLMEYRAVTRDRMATVRLFDGLAEVLAGLKGGGCRLGVLSSNSEENILTCLRANGVDALFDFVIDCPRLFGKARALRRLLRQQRLEPGRLLYVGDEVRDVQAARRAGVDAAAVGWGMHTPQQLAGAGPTYLWACAHDVPAALLSPAGGR
jgi:phosphoglycolate phosphatase